MKTIKKTKVFDAVTYMCQQREKLSEKLSKMTKAETIEYFTQIKEKSIITLCTTRAINNVGFSA